MISLKPRIAYDDEGRKIHTLELRSVNRFALLFLIPVILLFGVPYYLIYGDVVLDAFRGQSMLFLLLFIVLGVLVHEFLHAVFWIIFLNGRFRSIRFGIKWSQLTPYCHCKESLKVWQYAVGALAPLLFMGLLPSVWAMATGNSLLMLMGMFFTVAASGDVLCVLLLRGFKSSQMIRDHPEELGVILEVEDPEEGGGKKDRL